uniref:YihY family inner membrane protein n=1 Tax=Cellvibrio fontiphilus TaxID=1815559 RepID=UPI002B4BA3E9|nr:YihY family inner membrane protein [Cellvibrio fontiphilus]
MSLLSNLHRFATTQYCWLVGFFRLVVKQYRARGCQKSAASLTYVTLFATVPMLTVTFSMFSLIPAFQDLGDELQALLFQHLLPNSEQDLGKYLQSFSEQARQLTAFGFGFLLVSAYLMLKNIEENFNAIWGVTRGRRGVANFLLYWAILSLGPLLLGVALAMSTYLVSFRLLVGTYDNLGLVEWVLQFAPWVLTWAAFTLLFVAVPNCKVRVSHAMVGGAVTTLGFQGLKAAFGWIVSHSSFSLVYGAFAALPLFLLWVNLVWTVVLGGAVVVHTINAYQIGLRDRNYPDLMAALLVLWRCYEAAKQGASLPERVLIQLGLAAEQWQRISQALVRHRILTTNYQGEFLLSKNLQLVSLRQLIDMIELPNRSAFQVPAEQEALLALPWGGTALELLTQADQQMQGLYAITLGELFDAAPAAA